MVAVEHRNRAHSTAVFHLPYELGREQGLELHIVPDYSHKWITGSTYADVYLLPRVHRSVGYKGLDIGNSLPFPMGRAFYGDNLGKPQLLCLQRRAPTVEHQKSPWYCMRGIVLFFPAYNCV